MLKKRVIAVIIVKDGSVVQSESFKHTNVIHADAFHAVEKFNRWAIDEIVLLNVSPSRSSQESFLEIVKSVSRTCFIPLAVGGWVDSIEYGAKLVEFGADKLILNTLWDTAPEISKALSMRYGKQCIVASIDIKSVGNKKLVYVDKGRKQINLSAIDWANFCVKNGAGEVFFNNIDHDGMRRGYDLETIRILSKNINVPVIAFGGVSDWEHMAEGLEAGADAVAAANIFHYKELATKLAKKYLIKKSYNLRRVE